MRENPRPTLLCVPYAGGAARAFAGLKSAVTSADTTLLDLPGHGMRMREEAMDDLEEVLEDLARSTAPHTTGTYVLLGHSMGAALAYELARHWSSLGRPPAAVILLGRNGPTAPKLHPDIHSLAAPAFLDAIRRLGGTPPQVFQHPELVKLFAPVLRADFTISETYRALPGPPLSAPTWIGAGRDDTMVDDEGLRDWQRHTAGSTLIERLPGGHFNLDEPELHALVNRVLEQVSQTAALA